MKGLGNQRIGDAIETGESIFRQNPAQRAGQGDENAPRLVSECVQPPGSKVGNIVQVAWCGAVEKREELSRNQLGSRRDSTSNRLIALRQLPERALLDGLQRNSIEEVQIHFDPSLTTERRLVIEKELLPRVRFARALYLIAGSTSDTFECGRYERAVALHLLAFRSSGIIEVEVDRQTSWCAVA
jgi:hypothetical protein